MTRLRAVGVKVETGVFGAHMQVELLNDGPVTFLLDSRRRVIRRAVPMGVQCVTDQCRGHTS